MTVDPALVLIEILNPRQGERVLDAGCGIGTAAAQMSRAGAHVTGVDQLGVLLDQARIAAPESDFIEADLTAWQPAEPFDAIFACATLSWIQPADGMARRLFDWLKPGGRLAATLGGANESAKQLDAYYEPAPRDYRRVLERCGFRVEVLEQELGCLFVLAWRPEAPSKPRLSWRLRS